MRPSIMMARTGGIATRQEAVMQPYIEGADTAVEVAVAQTANISIERGGRTMFIHARMDNHGNLVEIQNSADPVSIPREVHSALGSERITGHDAVFVIGQRPRPDATGVQVSGDGTTAEGINVGASLTALNRTMGFCGTAVYVSIHSPE